MTTATPTTIARLATVAAAILLSTGHAGTLYWSADGTSAGGTGTWDTTNPRWGTAAGGPFATVWDNTANATTRAIIQTSPGTVTIQAGGISVGQIEPVGTWVFDGGPITIDSGIRNRDGGTTGYNATFENTIAIADTTTFNMRAHSILTINGQLSGSSALTITGGGSYAWALKGDNSGYSGPITLAGGSGVLGHDSAFGTGLVTLNGNLSLQSASEPLAIGNNFFTALLSNASRTMTLDGDHPTTFTGELRINPGINDGWFRFNVTSAEVMTWSGEITQNSGNARSIVKEGVGTLVLSGPNTYLGETTVEAGILYLDGTTSGMADHIVEAGGTLGGTGTVGLATGKLLTVETGAALAPGTPGAPVGTLTVNGDVTIETDTTYYWDYANGAGDWVSVSGTLTLPTVVTAVVNQVSGSIPAMPVLFTAATLAGETDLSQWVIEGLDDYQAAIRDNDVVLLPPPPGSLFLLR